METTVEERRTKEARECSAAACSPVKTRLVPLSARALGDVVRESSDKLGFNKLVVFRGKDNFLAEFQFATQTQQRLP